MRMLFSQVLCGSVLTPRAGVYSVIGLNSVQVLTIIDLRYFYVWRNSRADRGLTVIEGDPNFRYSL